MSDLIRDNRDEIVADWMAEAQQLARYSSIAELRDHIPSFLDTLALHLADGSTSNVGPAGAHAVQRLREGFDLRLVTAEYSALRRCLMRLAHRRSADPASVERMHEAIDEAMTEATEQYVLARQRALRESEERFLAIVEHAPALIAMKDTAGKYTLLNQQYEAIFGIPRGTGIGKSSAEIFPIGYAESIESTDRTVAETGATIEVEERAPIGNELRTWHVHKFAIRDADGAIAAVCSIGTDITSRKQAEGLRDHFVAVLGHDLRNPLQGILTALALAKTGQRGTDEVRRVVERGERQAGRMVRMINDLLDFARTRLGEGLPINRVPVNLSELSAEVVQTLKAIYPQRLVTLHVVGDVVGNWDRDRLMQVLDNLVGNALKHGDDPVNVLVRSDGTDAVVLEVTNFGRPIPADLLPVIFEPFRRHERSEHGDGLGLGLFIVKSIADAHGASVEVRSSSQSGTLFRIRWPRQAHRGALLESAPSNLEH